ncbi:YecA family protein [Rhodoplanes serenus]|uniref:YecA family protein n=1 Tax=Rhodoplanes serenus TaxID=200615 RepID=UPI00131CB5BF|nr:SEC-C domain-containing protein [Rhodoplanes serenus]
MARDGGSLILGWNIWEWPSVFIEAEHHSVYRSPSGQLFDITPSDTEDEDRLFLIDPTATYDFANPGVRRDNIRVPLSRNPKVLRFIEIGERQSEILNTIPGIGMKTLSGEAARMFQGLEREKRSLLFDLGMMFTGRNDRCFCGSGKKFKFCHGAQRS